jgi:hypothetical protein
MKMEQTVRSEAFTFNYRRREITQKKAHNLYVFISSSFS